MQEFFAAHPEYGTEEHCDLHWTAANDASHRIEHYWGDTNLEHYLADVRHQGFRAYVVSETLRRNQAVGFDGTFFDVAYFPW